MSSHLTKTGQIFHCTKKESENFEENGNIAAEEYIYRVRREI